jgi:hypothetical protein
VRRLPTDARPHQRLDPDRDERRIERIVLAPLVSRSPADSALLVVYILGGQTQIEGLLLVRCAQERSGLGSSSGLSG